MLLAHSCMSVTCLEPMGGRLPSEVGKGPPLLKSQNDNPVFQPHRMHGYRLCNTLVQRLVPGWQRHTSPTSPASPYSTSDLPDVQILVVWSTVATIRTTSCIQSRLLRLKECRNRQGHGSSDASLCVQPLKAYFRVIQYQRNSMACQQRVFMISVHAMQVDKQIRSPREHANPASAQCHLDDRVMAVRA